MEVRDRHPFYRSSYSTTWTRTQSHSHTRGSMGCDSQVTVGSACVATLNLQTSTRGVSAGATYVTMAGLPTLWSYFFFVPNEPKRSQLLKQVRMHRLARKRRHPWCHCHSRRNHDHRALFLSDDSCVCSSRGGSTVRPPLEVESWACPTSAVLWETRGGLIVSYPLRDGTPGVV